MEFAISMLKAIESIRNPFLDALFQMITAFGEEVILFGVVCIFYWCFNKEEAYKIGFIFFFSGIAIQGLKIAFRIPRPFVIDSSLTPVETAIENATGYSFPSGHTQAATSLYGYFAFRFKKIWLKALFVALFVLVAFSRMYLGVHTVFDVTVSVLLSLITVYLVTRFYNVFICGKHDGKIALIFGVASVLLCVFSYIAAKTGYCEISQINDCFKSGGAGLALAVGYYLERKQLRFDVSTPKIWMQGVKLIIGIAVALLLKSGLKQIAPDNLALDFVRYFLTLTWVVYLYPLLFSQVIKKIKRSL